MFSRRTVLTHYVTKGGPQGPVPHLRHLAAWQPADSSARDESLTDSKCREPASSVQMNAMHPHCSAMVTGHSARGSTWELGASHLPRNVCGNPEELAAARSLSTSPPKVFLAVNVYQFARKFLRQLRLGLEAHLARFADDGRRLGGQYLNRHQAAALPACPNWQSKTSSEFQMVRNFKASSIIIPME